MQTSFYLFHWIKGTPFGGTLALFLSRRFGSISYGRRPADQGEFADKTTWEQMDDGIPWTEAKKILIITPIVMWAVGSHLNNYSINYFLVTAVPLGFQIVPKFPEFNGVRLFGVNKFEE